MNEQQSRDEVLQNIKTLFTCSHLMYWSLLSDDDELKLFVPSSINPLGENNNTQLAMTSRGNPGVPQVSDSVSATYTNDDRDQPRSDRRPSHVETRWSVLASTPQSISTSNKLAALAPTEAGDDVPDDKTFTVVRSRQARRTERSAKRLRQASAVLTAQQAGQAGQQIDRKRLQGVTGRSSVVSSTLFAAVKTTEKAVLCIDNVSKNCNENDILLYVSGLGAEVISCFPTNPRRRPYETAADVQDRKAFRLCVNAADRERLLDCEAWPDSVRVSDWFRSKNNRPDKRRRINDRDRDRDLRSAAASSHSVAVASGGGAAPVDDVTVQRVDGADGAQGQTVTVPAVDTATVATVMDIADVEHPAAVATESDHDVHSDENDETTIYQHGVC